MKKWSIRQHDLSSSKEKIFSDFEIPSAALAVFKARGITDIRAFAEPEGLLSDPFAMKDMEKAAARILSAVESFERIAVYGDYDADGVTATAIVYEYLQACGADVLSYIPERDGEGYGLNKGAVDFLHQQGVKLIITVDNGISGLQEIEYAASLGMDVVVTDHHQPLETLPAACAVVDPHRQDDVSSCKVLSGVGVAFKLIMALEGAECDEQALLDNYADLVALGTVADVVPLTGENRALVRAGLELLPQTNRPGLQALMEAAGIAGREITSERMAFTLVPRINAMGRMGSPSRALRLLLTEEEEEAEALAQLVCEENDRRKETENQIVRQVLEQLQKTPERILDRVLVIAGEKWHPGVIGIVAARMAERLGKPVMILSCLEDEVRGSGRSVGAFSLFEEVDACKDLLDKYGGHPMAAGVTLRRENIEKFRQKINAYAARCRVPQPEILADCVLSPRQVVPELPEALSLLEPFGAENPVPLFILQNMEIQSVCSLGNGNHVRLVLAGENTAISCIRFGISPEGLGYQAGDVVDAVVSLENRVYQGRTNVSVQIREMRPAGMDTGNLLLHMALYERALREEPLSSAQFKILSPSRDDFVLLYRYLKGRGGFKGTCELLSFRLPQIPLARICFCLTVLQEEKLVEYKRLGDTVEIKVLPVQHKVDLLASPKLKMLHALCREKEGKE